MKRPLRTVGNVLFYGACLAIIGAWLFTSKPESLFRAYKAVDPDVPGRFEQEFVRGRIYIRCKIGGKYEGMFGFVDFRTLFRGHLSRTRICPRDLSGHEAARL